MNFVLGGLVLGVGLLVIGEIVLFAILFSKRKQWMQQLTFN